MSNKVSEIINHIPVEESKTNPLSAKSMRDTLLEVDLNQLFHLTYSFDILKKIIEKMANAIDG